MFGRGVSFYRWNCILADLGFEFKEEIIWNKSYVTSPLMNISRVHETISIFTKNKGTINKVKVPYLEMKGHDIDSIVTDIKRLKTTFKNTKSLNAVLEFLENNKVETEDVAFGKVTCQRIEKPNRCVSVMAGIQNGLNEKSIIHNINSSDRKHNDKHNTVASRGLKNGDRCAYVMSNIQNGLNEKTIIRCDRKEDRLITPFNTTVSKQTKEGGRSVNALQSITYGLNEKSIIKQVRDHYGTIHPTQKPVRLLERLLALVIPKDKEPKDIVVADFFAGSMSCMEAVYNMGMQGIATEIDEEYFEAGKKRIEKLQPKLIV